MKKLHPRYQLFLPSHHPVGIEDDALSYSKYAESICELIFNGTPENIGLTIGIFGDWGMGKSSLLLMIRDLLTVKKQPKSWRRLRVIKLLIRWTWTKKRRRAIRLLKALSSNQVPEPIVITFDAWKYGQGEAVWVGLLRAISGHIDQNLHVWTTVQIQLMLWARRIIWKKLFLQISWFLIRLLFGTVLLYIGLSLVQQAIGLLHQGTLLPWLKATIGVTATLASLWTVLGGLVEIVMSAFRYLLVAPVTLPSDLLRQTLVKKDLFSFEVFHNDLVDIIQTIGRPVVVLIDDLDRCPLEQIVPVLEAIKHFDTWSSNKKNTSKAKYFSNITFVLAADRRAIERAIHIHFKVYQEEMNLFEQQTFAREYLEKIVQIPFELPPLAPWKFAELLDARSNRGRK